MCPPKAKLCTLCHIQKAAADFNKDTNCSDGLKVGTLASARAP